MHDPKTYFVYIMSNRSKTLYTGVTNNLMRRVREHKEGTGSCFASLYKLDRLVYFERFAKQPITSSLHPCTLAPADCYSLKFCRQLQISSVLMGALTNETLKHLGSRLRSCFVDFRFVCNSANRHSLG